MIYLLSTIYLLAVAGLSLFGFLGLITLALYWRHRRDEFPLPAIANSQLPPVTVQLPVYNERFVVDRLIRAAASLDYPHELLQIQVIDDSTDDTTEKAAKLVAFYQRQGVDISLVHRAHRHGYKAGALADATGDARGEYLAIFDADFQPPADFLRHTIPHFINEPRLGMVQTRWGHLNFQDSPLTGAQAIALDKHFAMEQTVRHRANLFPKFNGAGGIWRYDCLQDAGGWQDDTVCEDLCLSTRAILRGWQFRFLNDVTSPAELPTTITAYKSQQARWAKGSIQCLHKYGGAILKDSNHSPMARLYAVLSMSAYLTHPLLLLMLLVQVPLLYLDFQFPASMLFFSLAGIGQPLLFILAQQVLHPDWRRRLRHLPSMLLVAVGTAASNSRAMLQVFLGSNHPFIRTPKGVSQGGDDYNGSGPLYRMPFDWILGVELVLTLYAALGAWIAVAHGNLGPLFFLLTVLLGSLTVLLLGLRDLRQG